MIILNAVESTFAADFYTVVDTSRSPAHNTSCPLHWVRDITIRKEAFLIVEVCFEIAFLWRCGNWHPLMYFKPFKGKQNLMLIVKLLN